MTYTGRVSGATGWSGVRGELPSTSYAPLLNQLPKHSFLRPEIASARGLIAWASPMLTNALRIP